MFFGGVEDNEEESRKRVYVAGRKLIYYVIHSIVTIVIFNTFLQLEKRPADII